jgi:ribonuclease VapC
LIVLDTSALIAILDAEPERDALLDALPAAERVSISAVIYYEAMLVTLSRRGEGGVNDLDEMLTVAEAEIIPFTAELAISAREAYARYGKGNDPAARLNLCDCVAYALAKALGAPLLFKGQDFAHTDVMPAKVLP